MANVRGLSLPTTSTFPSLFEECVHKTLYHPLLIFLLSLQPDYHIRGNSLIELNLNDEVNIKLYYSWLNFWFYGRNMQCENIYKKVNFARWIQSKSLESFMKMKLSKFRITIQAFAIEIICFLLYSYLTGFPVWLLGCKFWRGMRIWSRKWPTGMQDRGGIRTFVEK